MPASQPASWRATHGMGKPSWEQEEPTKRRPESWELGAQAGASPGTGHTACTGLAWGTGQCPDKPWPRPTPGFHLDRQPCSVQRGPCHEEQAGQGRQVPSRTEPGNGGTNCLCLQLLARSFQRQRDYRSGHEDPQDFKSRLWVGHEIAGVKELTSFLQTLEIKPLLDHIVSLCAI